MLPDEPLRNEYVKMRGMQDQNFFKTAENSHFVFTGHQEADESFLRVGSKKSRNQNRRHIEKKFSMVLSPTQNVAILRSLAL